MPEREHLTTIPMEYAENGGRIARQIVIVMSQIAAVLHPGEGVYPNGGVVLTNGLVYEFSKPVGAENFIKHLT